MRGRKKTVLLFLLPVCFCAQAQKFAWKSSLDTVPQTGFYSIPLSPEWLAALKTDLSDVRIRGENSQAVPFLIKWPPRSKHPLFMDFPVLANHTDSAFTTVELDVKDRMDINHLDLELGNTAVERKALLSGSNDRKEWFIVDENLFLKNRTGYDQSQFLQILVLPTIHYRYLRLKIYNRGTDPLLIKKAGLFTAYTDALPEPYFEKRAAFHQHDSTDGYSYIRIMQEAEYPVKRIWLHLSGPKFYARELKVYNGQARKGAELVAAATLQFAKNEIIGIQPVKMKTFLVTIENGDNPPLKVDSVSIYFTQRDLIAYLEKGKHYSLVGGDSLLSAPAYDLALFRDSIPENLSAVKHGPMSPFAQKETTPTQNNRWWLWPSVAIAIGLLLFLTVQLMKEVKRKED